MDPDGRAATAAPPATMDVMNIRFAISPHAGLRTSGEVLSFALAIQAAGFDGIWMSDLPAGPALDPLLALALIAGRTERLRLGANVVPLGRNPFLLAKELAQLDRLSDGRLLLSFVTGIDQAGERDVYGLNGAPRGVVLEEVLGLARDWWSGASVTHRSERWTFTGLASPARPIQDPLEVWLGGRGPKALDRVGRVADGWLGAQLTPAETAVARETIQAAAGRAGREVDPEHFGLSIPYARTAPDPELLRRLGVRRTDVDPGALVPVGADALRAFVEGGIAAGLSKFVVRPIGAVADWADEAAWLAAAVLHLQT
jgi:probable F420-dependent oxidoreductase